MSNDALLLAATITWFRENPNIVIRRLDDILRQNSRYSRRTIEWRTDTVTDFRGLPVPAAAERLLRWDVRHPDIIFDQGFIPTVVPYDHEIQAESADLGQYVDNNVPSIFVSTTRFYRQDGRNTRWTPRNIRDHFEYEIFAYGGIDVNLSLGQHDYRNQMEITFPGGIRSEFIRTARQYDENSHVTRIWANARFDVGASGDHSAVLQALPEPVCGSRVPVRFWFGPSNRTDNAGGHHELKRSADNNFEDLMAGPGAPQVDGVMEGICPTHPARACFINPITSTEAYIFAGTEYARITIKPGSLDDKIVLGPKNISTEWPSLLEAGFGSVDAVLPNPDNIDEAYFFYGTQYALIKVKPGTNDDVLILGPKVITSEWPSLRRAGFDAVDAVLPNPNNKDQAYFFRKTQYVLISVSSGTNDDQIVNGPKEIVTEWPSLRDANFSTVDMALPSPEGGGETYFFSGTQYVLIKLEPGTTNDTIINGPKRVASEWPSLHQARFY